MIDFHVHAYPSDVVLRRDHHVGADAWFGELYADPRRILAGPDQVLAQMGRDGTAAAVALSFPFRDRGLLREANQELAAAAAASGGRLFGMGMVDPLDPEAPAQVRNCAELGLLGIGELNADAQGFALADPALEPFLDAVRSLGLILLVHGSEPVGHMYPGKGSATPQALLGLIARCRGITVVLAHLGGGLPFYAAMPEVAELLTDTYFDTAALPYLYGSAALRAAGECVGFDRLLLGSDYPLLTLARYGPLIEAGIPEQWRPEVTGGTAQKLLNQAGIVKP